MNFCEKYKSKHLDLMIHLTISHKSHPALSHPSFSFLFLSLSFSLSHLYSENEVWAKANWLHCILMKEPYGKNTQSNDTKHDVDSKFHNPPLTAFILLCLYCLQCTVSSSQFSYWQTEENLCNANIRFPKVLWNILCKFKQNYFNSSFCQIC